MMAWLSLHIWMLLAAAALLGLLFGLAIRGLMLRSKLRQAQVERDMSAMELEQSKTEIEALYAAQRRAGAPDEELGKELQARKEAVQRLEADLKAAKSELHELRSGGQGDTSAAAGAAVAGAAVGAMAGGAAMATGEDDAGKAREELEWRNRYLESRVRRLEEEVRSHAASRSAAETPASPAMDAAPPQDGVSSADISKLRWQNDYLRQRLTVFEDKAARSDAGPGQGRGAASEQRQETPDEELARLRWRNRYLEGRLAYLEEEPAQAVEAPETGPGDDGPAPAAGAGLLHDQEVPAAGQGPEPVEADTVSEPVAPPSPETSGPSMAPQTPGEPEPEPSSQPVTAPDNPPPPPGFVTGTDDGPAPEAGTGEDTSMPEPADPVTDGPLADPEPASTEEHPAEGVLRDLDTAEHSEPAGGEATAAPAAPVSPETGAEQVPLGEEVAEARPDTPQDAASPIDNAESGASDPEPPGAEPVRPEPLAARPRDGGDDLTQIEGIGPRIKEVLNGLGIWQFEQIAGWDEGNASWIDQELNFSGRVSRQDWVGQARKLRSGT
ncbi:MAG: hypothetical protein GVY06_01075 [Alphaproteobacteria bacterium]|jgi:predicted flap endonuclease-1-like 5' DNA nuclease|nr:hypothetical protein [Alphaproteobacteria bacterium]